MASAERQARAKIKKLEKHPNRIQGESKPKTMPVAEWEYAQSLLRKNSDLLVISHPEPFVLFERSGKRREYTPDFLVVDPKAEPEHMETYVEITLGKNDQLPQNSKKDKDKIARVSGEVFDAKARQREIMSEVAQDAKFIVLYEEDLKKIQLEDEKFDPWRSENMHTPDKHSRRNTRRKRR